MYDSKAKISSSREKKLYGFIEHLKRPALWLLLLAAVAAIVLKSLDLRASYESPILLVSLNIVFIGTPSVLIAIIAARGFLRSRSWAALWMGIGSLMFGLTMVLSSLVLLWSTTNTAETTYNIGSLLTALLYIIGPLFILSNIPAQEIKPGRMITVVHVYLGVLICIIVIAIISFLELFPAFFMQGVSGTLLRQIILGTAMLLFILGGLLLLRHHLRFKAELVYWYALGLLTMSLAMACRLMQTAPGTPLSWMGRGAQLVAGVYLLTAVAVTLREARARRVSMGEALASFFIWQETNLKLLFESITEAIIVTNRKSIITGWNKAAENIYGWREEEVAGRQMNEVLQTRYPSGSVPDFTQTGSWKAEVVQKHKNGSERIILSSVSTLKDEEGRDSGLVAVNRDITERKRAEEELRQSERRYRSLAENIPSILMRFDKSLRFVYISPRAKEITGIPANEFIGKNCREVGMTEQIRVLWENAIQEVFQTGWGKDIEFDFPSKDEIKIFYLRLAPELDKDGAVSSVLGISTDITEHKRAEEVIARARDELEIKVKERTAELSKLNENLSEANKFNSGLLENSPIAIVVLESDGSIKYANPQFEKLLGYASAEILGRQPPFPWWPEEKREGYLKMLQSVMNGTMAKKEKLFIKKDGEECWTDTTLVPIIANKKTNLILASAVDITQPKRLRDELKLYSQRITQILEEERKHVARELHEDTAQSLAILKLELEAIIDSGAITAEKTLNRLVQLKEDTDRALQGMRRYSYELRPGGLDYLGLVAALDQLVEEINCSGNLDVSFEVSGEEYKLADEVELTLFRITQEALNNARKHAQASKATVNIKYFPEKIVLSISDNGKGFGVKEETESVLKRGSLGIVGMRERAQLIDADFKINSEPGKGTTITVELQSRDLNNIE